MPYTRWYSSWRPGMVKPRLRVTICTFETRRSSCRFSMRLNCEVRNLVLYMGCLSRAAGLGEG